jgi:hypothetical protein
MANASNPDVTDAFIIVGCGGIGYHLAEPLARYIASDSILGALLPINGEGSVNLVFIDGDRIEDRNVARVFSSRSVGQPKALTIAEKIYQLFPALPVTVIADYITSTKQFCLLIRSMFPNVQRLHIFGCVDNSASRLIIENSIAWFNEPIDTHYNGPTLISYVDGGNSFDEGQIRIQLGGSGYEYLSMTHPDFCTPISSRHPDLKDLSNPEDRLPTDQNCTDEYTSSPQLVLANNLVAALMASFWYSTISSRWYAGRDNDVEYFLDVSARPGGLHCLGNMIGSAAQANQVAFSIPNSTFEPGIIKSFRPQTAEERRISAATDIFVEI